MFSGLVRGNGRVAARTDRGRDTRLVVEYDAASVGTLAVGGSIAVNGVCLTAVEIGAGRFAADVSGETLGVTTFGSLAVGARVNLEAPLKAGDPLDGHVVTGHVDGVGRVVEFAPVGSSRRLVVEVPAALSRYLAQKGSVAVDGVSLTVNAVRGRQFEVNVIPHTLAVTTIGDYAVGTAVNIEVDMIARYVERLLGARLEPGE